MEQNIHRKGLVNLGLLLVLGAAIAIVGQYAHSLCGLVSGVFLGVGFLVAAVSYVQMRLEERERLEAMELDEQGRAKARGALFEGAEGEVPPARRARLQFERFVVPAFGVFLFVTEAAAAYLLWRHFKEDRLSTLQQATVAMALNALFALVLYQFGKYSAVLARLEKERLLRPQSSYLMLGALLSLITALVEVAGWAGYPRVDFVVSRLLIVVLGLVAVENVVALLFEVYRPRVQGQAAHPLYESRLIGLLSQPGGLITTAAQALDYQFGFKVSHTWFYRFLERAFAWLLLGQLVLLMLSTCFAFVEPGEQALLERFGQPVQGRDVLGPGLHVKWPWPIDKIHRYATDRIQGFTLGAKHDEEEEGAHAAEERVLLWAKSHAKEEYNLLVASRSQRTTNLFGGEQAIPVNLLAVNVPVQYQVQDLRAYAYNHVDAGALLERLAAAELTRYLVGVDIDDVMRMDRIRAAEDLRKRMQQRADALQLGVRIVFVGLHEIHPPVKVAAEFEKVIGAIQDKAATNHYARAYLATNVPVARGMAAQKVNEAETYRVQTVAASEAATQRFTNQVAAYHASPEVYRVRTYLDGVGRAVGSARTYILAVTNAHGVVVLNLEEKVRRDLLDISVPKTGP